VTRPIRFQSLPHKLDSYRAIAVKSDNKVQLLSRRQESFNQQYPYIVEALSDLPDGTVVDGEKRFGRG
jgi:ATP-dependent DNA ligase